MAGKTLKIYSYRGVNVYCRWLGEYQYEVLVAYKGGIYAHQLHVLKPRRNERRNSLDERHKGAQDELQFAASSLIDNLIKENSVRKVVKKKINEIIHSIIYGNESTKIEGDQRKDAGIS